MALYQFFNIILNSVRQHNHFITQGNYKTLHVSTIDLSSSGLFCQLCHKMLCTLWYPIVFTSMEYMTNL